MLAGARKYADILLSPPPHSLCPASASAESCINPHQHRRHQHRRQPQLAAYGRLCWTWSAAWCGSAPHRARAPAERTFRGSTSSGAGELWREEQKLHQSVYITITAEPIFLFSYLGLFRAGQVTPFCFLVYYSSHHWLSHQLIVPLSRRRGLMLAGSDLNAPLAAAPLDNSSSSFKIAGGH